MHSICERKHHKIFLLMYEIDSSEEAIISYVVTLHR